MKIGGYIDRFEGEIAVLYLGDELKKIDFPRSMLGNDLEEGDYIQLEISIDQKATDEARREALRFLDD